MRDAGTMTISLRLCPPGMEEGTQQEFTVPLEGEARLPQDKVTAWVEENQGKHICTCGCGREIKVIRRYYWRGIPEFHPACRHKGMQRKRAILAKGFYTGMQAAKKLGIGRTTLNRWIKKGTLHPPAKSTSGMLLFSKDAIDRYAPSI
jgi:predicted DNA-binding transcriptional regulator AlpA